MDTEARAWLLVAVALAWLCCLLIRALVRAHRRADRWRARAQRATERADAWRRHAEQLRAAQLADAGATTADQLIDLALSDDAYRLYRRLEQQ